MSAYYNEIDEKAAAWLRELIKARLIADGEVDTRSIVDVRPGDLRGFRQCHFFAGIGGWSYALRLAGWPDDRHVWTGSCPCQPFSSAGKGRGTEDARHLWPQFRRLIRQCRPSVVFGEQVASKAGRVWLSAVFADAEALAYRAAGADLCGASVGAPHIRQRLYFVLADCLGIGRERRTDAGRSAGEGAAEWREGLSDIERGGVPGELADSLPAGRAEGWAIARRGSVAGGGQGRIERWDGADQCATRPASVVSELADTLRDASEWRAGSLSGAQAASDSTRELDGREPDGLANGGEAGVVGHADHAGSQGRIERWDGADQCTTRPAGVASELADSNVIREPKECASDQSGREQQAGRRAAVNAWAGTAGRDGAGFWSECDWIPCRDGKARPVEPGSFPLAHGIPARVGRLRGYGNAIVPQVAAAFIAAADECL
jgi:DNA (cytosine-5)-methyltransferase 1